MNRIIFTLCGILWLSALNAQLQSPDDFLPHSVGSQFTPHHMLVDYMYHVADNSPLVQIKEYGTTNEDRPLLLLTISSEDNLKNLEDIRINNLYKTGLLDGSNNPTLDKAIVWLSFSVHGNEASGSESSMLVLYDLVNPNNPTTKKWLENTVVVFDPSINPDGYDRFTHWFRQVSHKIPDANPQAREQSEPWPGGRVNHYYYDLNRDWAWQTQVESQQRIKQYHQWMPHVHVDFHEMGANSPYFFAPASKPMHEYITPWQKSFQEIIGKNNAKYFEKNGWLYFTKEVFDLLYPSYGDTWPTYNGAIGMTFEQGASRSRAYQLANGETLTLLDRVKHHHAAALSTIEAAHLNKEKLVSEFENYFQQSIQKAFGPFNTYLIKADNVPHRIQALTALLEKNKIAYGLAGSTYTIKAAYNYNNQQTQSIDIAPDDLIISAHQPKSVLTQVLFDPDTYIEDSLTYDITAWSLPYVYGLDAFAIKDRILPQQAYTPTHETYPATNQEETPYAFIGEWKALNNAAFLAELSKEGILARVAMEPFSLSGKDYNRGTIVITQADNLKIGESLSSKVWSAANTNHQKLTAVQTGYADQGPDLGSRKFQLLQNPKVVVLAGDGVYANSYGQVWHFFEQTMQYPFHTIEASNLGRANLHSYNTLILPEGRYRFSNNDKEKLKNWINQGGRVIAIGSANRVFANESDYALTEFNSNQSEKQYKEMVSAQEEAERLMPFADRRRNSAADNIPGAFFKLHLDQTHPLGFGLDPTFFTLKNSELAYQHLNGVDNVGYLKDDLMVIGFAGSRIKEKLKNTTTYAVESKGRGAVIYLIDNPLFRSFWENGKFLFSNALFFAGQ